MSLGRASRFSSADGIRRQRGSVVAEVALVLPVMMLVFLGLIDLGRGLAVKAELGHAARAATRYASVRSTTSSDPATYAKSAAFVRDSLHGLDSEAVEVTSAWVPANTRGARVQVSVRYTFDPIMPFLPVQSIELASSSESIISN